jgi:Beta-glucosidase-related glycosidases
MVMNKRKIALIGFFGLLLSLAMPKNSMSQNAEKHWVDSVFYSLTLEERVAQLICMRANQSNKPFDGKVAEYIRRYNIGGVCFFRADAAPQVEQTNCWQQLAKTPLLVSIDGEWGLGMRVNNTLSYPYQMTLGAISNNDLIYLMGQQIAEQCHRMGIHVNFAPDVDVNSNARNPVIGMRSFGENPQNVAQKGAAYALGMQSRGLITSMKHFPGHGNTQADSHFSLPTVNSSYQEVQNVELYPFRYLIEQGVNGVMVGHLYFPAIEPVRNTSSSLSPKVTTELLRNELNFDGLIFTDGLEMKGVSEKTSQDSVPYLAFLAGSDVLLLPTNVPFAIRAIKEAAERDPLIAAKVNESCRRVLQYKFKAGLSHCQDVAPEHVLQDLKKKEYYDLNQKLFDEAVTLLKNDDRILPLLPNSSAKVATVTIGNGKSNQVSRELQCNGFPTKSFIVAKDKLASKMSGLLQSLKSYDIVILNIQNTSMFATKEYGINAETISFYNKLLSQNQVILNLFACPYALNRFADNENLKALIVAYEDRPEAVNAAVSLLVGKHYSKGKLPVSAGIFKVGDGICTQMTLSPKVMSFSPLDYGYARQIDSIAKLGIEKGAYPGCQIVALKDGKVIYDSCFGKFTYEGNHKVLSNDVYDVASLTKVFASTLAMMKLYEDGLVDLNKTLGDFFPFLNKSDKGAIKLIDIMTHQSGMKAWIPFYAATIDENGPKAQYYNGTIDEQHSVRVAENLYLSNDYEEKIFDEFMMSEMKEKTYVYCDMGFFFVPKLVKLLTNQSFEEYLNENFYEPLQLENTFFCPLKKCSREHIAPTEKDNVFRQQLLWGDVHDQAAALFGGISGHAGLFSNARDLAVIMQLLLDGGQANGRSLLKPETIKYFTSAPFAANNNRRGIGFDKLPIDKNGPATASKKASMSSFGHSGFTGTFAWADPENGLVYVFLSNRVYPDAENTLLSKMNIRTKLHDLLYEAVKVNRHLDL